MNHVQLNNLREPQVSLELSVEQIYEFLDVGYLQLELHDPKFGNDFSQQTLEVAQSAYAKNASVRNGNDPTKYIADTSLDSIPEVDALLGSDELNAALTNLLGSISTDIVIRMSTAPAEATSRSIRILRCLGVARRELGHTNSNGSWLSTIHRKPHSIWDLRKFSREPNIGTWIVSLRTTEARIAWV